jgi:peptidyl-prolyl cis-trans isomerase A (cyclophilin A)
MMFRFPALLLAALASPLLAQPAVPPVAQTALKEDLVRVALETGAGRIVIALDRGRAPVTSANFLKYVDGGKYDGETFYRAMPYGEGGLLQGGITSDSRKLYPPIAHEPTGTTGLRHVAGALSMASLGPGTARADFFILTTDIPALDSTPADPGFAVFGHVVEGMDVVKMILAAPVSATKGDGALKGQMLENPVRIVSAKRLDP